MLEIIRKIFRKQPFVVRCNDSFLKSVEGLLMVKHANLKAEIKSKSYFVPLTWRLSHSPKFLIQVSQTFVPQAAFSLNATHFSLFFFENQSDLK